MCILQKSYEFLKENLLPQIPLKHQGLFTFGFEALTIKPFISLNGNARTTIKGRKTAESKMYRVVHQEKFLDYFPRLIINLGLVTEKDIVNVDFSTFGGYYVLTFAKQTSLGRAIPLYFATITYPIES